MSARKVTLLPDPDSPRMQSTSPGLTENVTPLTAWTVDSRVTKRTVRSLTSTRGALSISGLLIHAGMTRVWILHVAGRDVGIPAQPIAENWNALFANRLRERAPCHELA